jgi:hypothetical protein
MGKNLHKIISISLLLGLGSTGSFLVYDGISGTIREIHEMTEISPKREREYNRRAIKRFIQGEGRITPEQAQAEIALERLIEIITPPTEAIFGGLALFCCPFIYSGRKNSYQRRYSKISGASPTPPSLPKYYQSAKTPPPLPDSYLEENSPLPSCINPKE